MNIPLSFMQQWPFLAITLTAIGVVFGLLIRNTDARITDLKEAHKAQLADLRAAYERQIAELRERIGSLEGEADAWQKIAFSGTVLAERAASVADHVAHTAPAADGAKPGAIARAARRIAGGRAAP